jgi:hypothetical protein
MCVSTRLTKGSFEAGVLALPSGLRQPGPVNAYGIRSSTRSPRLRLYPTA